MRTRYEVFGWNGPYRHRIIYSAGLLRDAKAVAEAVAVQGVDMPEGHLTFQKVMVFRSGRTLGRFVYETQEVPK